MFMKNIDIPEWPFVSLFITTYCQENFVAEALESAFRQDYAGDMEIIVSDDASTDTTWDVIQNVVSKNLHSRFHVVLHRNDSNLGIGGNVAYCLKIAGGKYIIGAAGDDISLPNRVSTIVSAYIYSPQALLIDSNYSFLCGKSICLHADSEQRYSLKEFLHAKVSLNGCTRSINKCLVDAFPPISIGCPTEDSVLILRAFLLGNTCYSVLKIRETLVHYRISSHQVSSSENIGKINRLKIFEQYRKDIWFAIFHGYISLKYVPALLIFLYHYGIAAMLQKSKLWSILRKKKFA